MDHFMNFKITKLNTQNFVKTTSRRQAQPQLNSTSTQLKLTELGTTQLKLVIIIVDDVVVEVIFVLSLSNFCLRLQNKTNIVAKLSSSLPVPVKSNLN